MLWSSVVEILLGLVKQLLYLEFVKVRVGLKVITIFFFKKIVSSNRKLSKINRIILFFGLSPMLSMDTGKT